MSSETFDPIKNLKQILLLSFKCTYKKFSKSKTKKSHEKVAKSIIYIYIYFTQCPTLTNPPTTNTHKIPLQFPVLFFYLFILL